MIKTFSDSAFASQSIGFSELKIALVEPALVVSAAFFWVAALPFVALSLRCVKIWDTLTDPKSVAGIHPHPLILREGLAKSERAPRNSDRTAQS